MDLDSNPLHASLRRSPRPIWILSSLAGRGNYSVGEAIRCRLDEPGVAHRPIEELLPPAMVRRHFGRHRLLCQTFPALLRLLYAFPVRYRLAELAARVGTPAGLTQLQAALSPGRVGTVVATSHRAAFWVAALKRRLRLPLRLLAVLTDYGLSPGWRHIFWDQVDEAFGPLPAATVPPAARARYRTVPLPLPPAFDEPFPPGDPDQVLVAGGGWGLGPIDEAVRVLRGLPLALHLHVACGDNARLYSRLERRYGAGSTVSLYGLCDSLRPLLARCRSVVSKPGALTLAEASAAGRAIFLLRPLPVVEEANYRYALERLAATPFSAEAFTRWRSARVDGDHMD